MEFRFTPEEEAFRQEIRGFLRAELPADWAASGGAGGLSGPGPPRLPVPGTRCTNRRPGNSGRRPASRRGVLHVATHRSG